jgi:hypothetical protein
MALPLPTILLPVDFGAQAPVAELVPVGRLLETRAVHLHVYR